MNGPTTRYSRGSADVSAPRKPWEIEQERAGARKPWQDDDEAAIERQQIKADDERRAGLEAEPFRMIVKGLTDYAIDTGIAIKNFVSLAAEQSARRELEADGVMSRQGGPDTGKVQGLRETQVQVSAENAADRTEDAKVTRKVTNDALVSADLVPHTGIGEAGAGIITFASKVYTLGVAGRGSQAATWGGFAAREGSMAVRSATATVMSDPAEESLSALIEEYPSLSNPLTRALATDDDDTESERLLKRGLEDLGLSAAFTVLSSAIKVVKAHRAARAAAEHRPTAHEVVLPSERDAPSYVEDELTKGFDADDAAELAGTPDYVAPKRQRREVGRLTMEFDPREGKARVWLTEDRKSLRARLDVQDDLRTGEKLWYVREGLSDPSVRGSGVALEAFDTLAREAQKNGAVLATDSSMSKDAMMFMDALAHRGYAFWKNPEGVLEFDGTFKVPPGEASFKVLSVPAQPPARATIGAARGGFTAQNLKNPEALEALRQAFSTGAHGFAGLADDLIGGVKGMVPTEGRIAGHNAVRIDWTSFGEDADSVALLFDRVGQAAEDQVQKMGAARVSQKDTAATARSINQRFGIDNMNSVYLQATSDGGHAARLYAAHQLLQSHADYIVSLGKKIAAKGAAVTEGDKRELVMQLQVFAAGHAKVRGATAEYARAMAVLGRMRKAHKESHANFTDIARQIGLDPDSVKLAETLSGATTRKLSDLATRTRVQRALAAHREYFVNNLLSGGRTQIINILSNGYKAVIEAPIERLGAAGLGALRRKVSKLRGKSIEGDQGVVVEELQAMLFGSGSGLRMAFKMPLAQAKQWVKAGFTEDADLLAKMKAEFDADEWGSVYKAAFTGESSIGTIRPDLESSSRKAISMEIDENPQTTWDRALNVIAEGVVNPAGSILRTPTRVLATADELFKSIAYEQERYAQAYRRAAVVKRSESPEFRKVFGDRGLGEMADEILKDGDEATLREIADEAMSFAKYQTYQTELHGIGKDVEGVIARNPVIRYAVPFLRTPLNIVKQAAFERTPLGLAAWGDVSGRNGLAKADLARARIIIGTSTLVSLMFVGKDRLRGGGVDTATELGTHRHTANADGGIRYSIRIGDTWYEFSRADPIGFTLGMAADIRDAVALRHSDETGSEIRDLEGRDPALLRAFNATALAFARNVTSKTWVVGLSNLIDVFGEGGDADDAIKLIKGLAAPALIPGSSLMRSIAQEVDPVQREVWGVWDGVQAGLPGVSKSLPEKRDWLGRVVKHPERWGSEMLMPIIASKQSTDPLDVELTRLSMAQPNTPKSVDKTYLTPSQYSEMLRIMGEDVKIHGLDGKPQTLREALTEEIGSARYAKYTDEAKARALTKIRGKYLRKAQSRLFHSDPTLQARAARLDDLLAVEEQEATQQQQ